MNSDGIEDADYKSDSELRFLRIKSILIINFIIDPLGNWSNLKNCKNFVFKDLYHLIS